MTKFFAGAIGVGMLAFAVGAQADTVVYNSIQNPLPSGVVSEGFQCCQTSELGNLVAPDLSSGITTLNSATVVMNNWAYESEWEQVGTSAGYNVPLTLTIYNVGAGNSLGSVLGAVTTDTIIPWRPEPDPTDCAAGSNNNYFGGDGVCHTGSTSLAYFDFSSLGISLPSQFIYGISYNTESYGANPIGVDGPYDSLNVGLTTTGPTVGANGLPADDAYVNDSSNGFAVESGWAPYSVEAEFTAATPEPATFGLIGLSLFGLGALRKRVRS